MMAVAKRKQWSLVMYCVLVPFYWLMISVASYYALYELIVRPYHWNKTKHGLHLKKEESVNASLKEVPKNFEDPLLIKLKEELSTLSKEVQIEEEKSYKIS